MHNSCPVVGPLAGIWVRAVLLPSFILFVLPAMVETWDIITLGIIAQEHSQNLPYFVDNRTDFAQPSAYVLTQLQDP